jgi:hypothetical protein
MRPELPSAQITLKSIFIAMIWFSVYLALGGIIFRNLTVPLGRWIAYLPCNPISGAILGAGIGALFRREAEGIILGISVGIYGTFIFLFSWPTPSLNIDAPERLRHRDARNPSNPHNHSLRTYWG